MGHSDLYFEYSHVFYSFRTFQSPQLQNHLIMKVKPSNELMENKHIGEHEYCYKDY